MLFRSEISVLFQDLALDKKTAVRKAHVIVGEKEAAQAKIMTQYSLEVIIGIGLRLKSEKARQFQHATSQILISYLKRGYAVNKGYVKRRTSWLSRLEALVRKLRED